MALTITGLADSKYYPANNEMIYTLSSSNVSEPNFRYIADVYINGSSDYSRLEVVAHPTYSSGVVDISGIIQNHLTSNPEDNTSTFKTCGNHICEYIVQFGEQYGPSSGVTTYPDLTSRTAFAYNAVFDNIDYLSYDNKAWTLEDSGTRFLTDCPEINHTITDKLLIGFLVNATNVGNYLEVSTYEADGSFQDTVRILNPYNTISANERRSIDVDVSYAWLTSLTTGDLASGSAPFIVVNTAFYTVKMVDNTFADTSETIRINIVDTCSKNTPVRFKFMNNYGKYDYYTFTGATKKNVAIKRNSFKKPDYDWSASGYTRTSRSRGSTQYETVLTDTLTVVSDWLTEDESAWLEQLVSSPDVYVYRNGSMVAVEVIAGNYEPKYESSDQLFNLTLTYKYAYNRVRQRR